jgi:hypothetical protein
MTSLDECQMMENSNECSKGIFKADTIGWSKTISITTGQKDSTDWCFCHIKEFSPDNYFTITYHKFVVSCHLSMPFLIFVCGPKGL